MTDGYNSRNLMITSLLTITLLAIAAGAPAAEPSGPIVAVAANFTGAMEKIEAAYERGNGVKLRTVYSSTGKLYAQIKNSAPFDLFLAADAKRPELLAEEGLCEEPFVYATGRAVLWGKNPALAGTKDWREVVVRAGIDKIAISTPETAPYGAAALTALEKTGLLARLQDKLVYGQNVAQAFQYAFHGSTGVAFTALSFALSDKGREGTYWPIPEAPAVIQKGCMVKNSAEPEAVVSFLKFFRRQEAQKILAEFGYR